MPIVNKWDK
ncbi:hypothetical protein MAR_035418 [Mya arenaria]|uniref:Uncharacterized protein n=1 Tax=Mya arenaria TaxID=6604 RepID=A0ABY7EK19_MYAAR|nr:hypothetical protein MAR_035418 [Mya arenaria]